MSLDVGTPVFLTVIVLVVPALAWSSRKILDEERVRIPRKAFYIEAIVLQIVLLGLALWMMHEREIVLSLAGSISTRAVGLTAAALLATLVTMAVGWRFTGSSTRRRLEKIAPRSASERYIWILVSAVAGICEEIIFRGALFELFREMTGGRWWPAALAAAVVFGLAHLAQGFTSAGIIVAFGLGLQALVGLTGGLLLVMILHFLYDLIVGVVVGSLPEGSPDGSSV